MGRQAHAPAKLSQNAFSEQERQKAAQRGQAYALCAGLIAPFSRGRQVLPGTASEIGQSLTVGQARRSLSLPAYWATLVSGANMLCSIQGV
jgi:hypothetical protein